jgi:hypothetical protein
MVTAPHHQSDEKKTRCLASYSAALTNNILWQCGDAAGLGADDVRTQRDHTTTSTTQEKESHDAPGTTWRRS